MNYKHFVTDTNWAAFVLSPQPVLISNLESGPNKSGRVETLTDTARGYVGHNAVNDKGVGELGLSLHEGPGRLFIETMDCLETRGISSNKAMDGMADLGTFYEFITFSESNVYIAMFVHNIAEYQAKSVANDMSIKFWASPRGYNDGSIHYDVDMSAVFFPDKFKSSARSSLRGMSAAEKAEAKSIINRAPGMFSINCGTRTVGQYIRKLNPSMDNDDLAEEGTRFLSRKLRGGWSMEEIINSISTEGPAPLNFGFVLPHTQETYDSALRTGNHGA